MPRIKRFNNAGKLSATTKKKSAHVQNNEEFSSASASTSSCSNLESSENIEFNQISGASEIEQIPNCTHSEIGPSTNEGNNLDEYSFISKEEYDSIIAHELCIEKEKPIPNNVISGNRLVNLQYVIEWSMKLQVEHAKRCTVGQMKLIGEHQHGLTSTLVFQCDFCDYKVKKCTQKPTEENDINIRATWATIATGNTYTPTNEILSVMNVPNMSYEKFHGIEESLGIKWKEQLSKSIKKAGEEEKNIAIKKGHVDQDGTPWTSVYCDGGYVFIVLQKKAQTKFSCISGGAKEVTGILFWQTLELLLLSENTPEKYYLWVYGINIVLFVHVH